MGVYHMVVLVCFTYGKIIDGNKNDGSVLCNTISIAPDGRKITLAQHTRSRKAKSCHWRSAPVTSTLLEAASRRPTGWGPHTNILNGLKMLVFVIQCQRKCPGISSRTRCFDQSTICCFQF